MPSIQQKQKDYQTNIAHFEAKDLIYIDETGSVRNLTRSHDRSPKNQRAHCGNSLTKGARISTIGALGIDGLLTAFCYEGTLTAFLFAFFVKEFLVPVLKPFNVVILDNAKSHYFDSAIAMIEAFVSGVIFLPQDEPELNPIKHVWAKIKSFLKKTVISVTSELYQAIAMVILWGKKRYF